MRIEQGPQTVSLTHAKAHALLAYLVLQPGFHRHEALVDLFWPEETAKSGSDNLAHMLRHLRETLGDAYFASDHQGVRLCPEAGLWVDAQVFTHVIEKNRHTLSEETSDRALAEQLQQLTEAVARYQGPFLQGLSVCHAPALEQWIEQQRTAFLQRLMFAERLLADGYVRLDNLEQAITHARQHVTLAPNDEEGWQYLLELLLRASQREQAEEAYTQLTDLIAQELNQSSGDHAVCEAPALSSSPVPFDTDSR